jgi:hypothetical protein
MIYHALTQIPDGIHFNAKARGLGTICGKSGFQIKMQRSFESFRNIPTSTYNCMMQQSLIQLKGPWDVLGS